LTAQGSLETAGPSFFLPSGMSHPTVWPGKRLPLGATFDGAGVSFAVFSEHAERIEVCLFDPAHPEREVDRFLLPEMTAHTFHGYVPGLKPGALYGFRAHGDYAPARGRRFNAHKLLVDPYARAIHGKLDWKAPVLDSLSDDDAAGVPKSVVVTDDFDWEGDQRLETPWQRTFIYELHVRGFTRTHPEVPADLRGTYGGLASPAAIAHFRALGVTAVELLPVHEAVDEGFLTARGLSNYWGYNTLGYFAPDQRFSSRGSLGGQVTDFKAMVRALHRAGIEVILDVVYNHTCEGNHLGSTLSLRGLDNEVYYRLVPGALDTYEDLTGCGNTLNVQHPQVLKLILDSLRYWVVEMHVDGFRFDEATALGREGAAYRRESGFMRAVHQDPVLSRVKLIAEPWDLGPGGYEVGNYPVLWSEWNDKYRDTLRRFWRGDESGVAELGYRLTGSSDLYRISGRNPSASINFITAHDGFTLQDLVSYERKHNQANADENRDGNPNNLSWSCGVEGETDDPLVTALRERQKRNLIASLFLSQGVPMLCAGDEIGRTQKGNNNAYCQDNETSWLDWKLDGRKRALFEFTARMARLRRDQPVLQRRRFFRGTQIWDSAFKDLAWFRPDGKEMSEGDWQSPDCQSLGVLLGGDAIPTLDERGERIVGDTLLALLNACSEPRAFTLPAVEWGASWEIFADTSDLLGDPRRRRPAGGTLEVAGRSLVVLLRPPL
jgi:isoamylase